MRQRGFAGSTVVPRSGEMEGVQGERRERSGAVRGAAPVAVEVAGQWRW